MDFREEWRGGGREIVLFAGLILIYGQGSSHIGDAIILRIYTNAFPHT